jgi:hypothetical protein
MLMSMKRLAIMILAAISIPSAAFTWAGAIGVFSDAAGTNCNVYDTPDGYIPLYIYHTYSTGAKGSEFKLVVPAGWTHLGDIPAFEGTVGTPLEGVSIDYVTCRTGNFFVYQCSFLGDGSTPACSETAVQIVPSPNASTGGLQGIDCTDKIVPLGTYSPVVNNDGTCPLVPVETTTWGGIKALYE